MPSPVVGPAYLIVQPGAVLDQLRVGLDDVLVEREAAGGLEGLRERRAWPQPNATADATTPTQFFLLAILMVSPLLADSIIRRMRQRDAAARLHERHRGRRPGGVRYARRACP